MEKDADTFTTSPGQPGQSNARIGFLPEEEPERRGPGVRERISEMRQALAGGADPAAVIQRALNDAASRVAAVTAPEGDGAASVPATPDSGADDDGLPDGFSITDRGQIKGPDGKFWSEDKVLAWIQNGGKLPADWKEPQADADRAAEPEKPEAPEPEAKGTEQPEATADDDLENVPDAQIVRFTDADGVDYEIVVEDENTARRLREKINDGLRRDEFNRQMQAIEADRAELDFIYDSLKADPTNFIMEQVADPKIRSDLAIHLLSDRKIWQRVQEEYGGLPDVDEDDLAIENKRLKLENERLRKRMDLDRQLSERRARREAVLKISDECQRYADLLDDDRAELFMRHAGRDIAEYVRQHKLAAVDPRDVPVILKRMGTLALFGLPDRPPAAQADSSRAATTTGSGQGARSPAGSNGSAGNGKVADPKAHAERFKRAIARRRQATAVSRGGAGAAPGAALRPPEGQTVKERIAWARQHFNVGR